MKKRIEQHKNGTGTNFTKKYNVIHLIYAEDFKAKKREKQLKNWYKEWKWNLIKETNPLLETIEIK